MLHKLYTQSMSYFSKHPILNSTAHAAAGFGLALILLHYMPESTMLSPMLGWILVAFSAVIHILSFIQ